MVKKHANSNGIHRLVDEDMAFEDLKDIEEYILSFYKTLYDFSDTNNVFTNFREDMIVAHIPRVVSKDENSMLVKCPFNDEIRKVVFALYSDSAPGPNGFGGSFFHGCWDIVGSDVCNAIKQFFSHNWILLGMNANVVSLIPKIHGSTSIKDFKPIVVAKFRFKIISKILIDKLASIAARIVSPNQNDFIKGWHIKDCIGITSEAINMLSKKIIGGNVAFKIDISKAFDSLSWDFLIKVLKQFGFHHTFLQWILTILQSAKFSIRVNSSLVGYFSYSRVSRVTFLHC